MTEQTSITTTPLGRIVFPQLFEAKKVRRNGKEVGEPIFSQTMLFEPGEELDGLKRVAARVAKEKWGSLDGIRFPFTDGNKQAEKAEAKGQDGGFWKGKVALKMKSQFKPGVVGPDKKEIIDTSKVYSGIYGYAEVNFVATEFDDDDGAKKYITAYVNFVMKAKDGDRIAGRSAADAFAGIKGQETDYDPSTGVDADEEILF